jgi:hypothetical protein
VQEGEITRQNDGWSEKRMHDKAGNILYMKKHGAALFSRHCLSRVE